MIPDSNPYILIDGDKEWRQAVYDKQYVVSFASNAEEDAYEKKDAVLNQRITDALRQRLGEGMKGNVSIEDDWWPSQCRYIDISASVLNRELIEHLRKLLSGDYHRWRIQVIVYDGIRKGSTEFGGLMIYSDKVLVERNVLKAVDLAM